MIVKYIASPNTPVSDGYRQTDIVINVASCQLTIVTEDVVMNKICKNEALVIISNFQLIIETENNIEVKLCLLKVFHIVGQDHLELPVIIIEKKDPSHNIGSQKRWALHFRMSKKSIDFTVGNVTYINNISFITDLTDVVLGYQELFR